MYIQKILKKVTWALQILYFFYLKITAVASGVVEGERGTRGNAVAPNIFGGTPFRVPQTPRTVIH